MNAVENGYCSQFKRAPLILQGYLVFVVAPTVLNFSVIYAPSLNRAMVPYTGWSSLYMFTLYFAAMAIHSPQRKLIYAGCLPTLTFIVLIGAYDAARQIWGPDDARRNFDNPYLTYNPHRPAFTIGLPLAWLMLLLSPVMRKWIHRVQGEDRTTTTLHGRHTVFRANRGRVPGSVTAAYRHGQNCTEPDAAAPVTVPPQPA